MIGLRQSLGKFDGHTIDEATHLVHLVAQCGVAGEAWGVVRQMAGRWILDGDPADVPESATNMIFSTACRLIGEKQGAPSDRQAAAAVLFHRVAVVFKAKDDDQGTLSCVVKMLSCFHRLRVVSLEAATMEAEVRLEFEATIQDVTVPS
jgi:hypothetical protein